MQLKQPILADATEIRDGYAIVRDGETTEVFSLDWYRVRRVDNSMVELRKPDGPDGGDAA